MKSIFIDGKIISLCTIFCFVRSLKQMICKMLTNTLPTYKYTPRHTHNYRGFRQNTSKKVKYETIRPFVWTH